MAPGRANVPWIAALHPIHAFVVLGLGVAVARRAMVLARTAEVVETPAEEEPASTAPMS
jgi:hypothetical protein